jgi:hypothetical protein
MFTVPREISQTRGDELLSLVAPEQQRPNEKINRAIPDTPGR